MQLPYQSVFTSNFSGMSVKFSPFNPNLLAFTTADNFGVVGKGKLFILELCPDM